MDSAGRSKMTGLGGGLPPRIVPAVGVSHWRCNELVGGHIVECAELDRYKVAADLLDVAAAEWAHAAMLAEQVMAALGRELIVAEVIHAGNQSKCLGLDDDPPIPRFGTDRAVALPGASGEVDVCLVTYCAAVAASLVGLQHPSF